MKKELQQILDLCIGFVHGYTKDELLDYEEIINLMITIGDLSQSALKRLQ